jgi:hypothetical protein
MAASKKKKPLKKSKARRSKVATKRKGLKKNACRNPKPKTPARKKAETVAKAAKTRKFQEVKLSKGLVSGAQQIRFWAWMLGSAKKPVKRRIFVRVMTMKNGDVHTVARTGGRYAKTIARQRGGTITSFFSRLNKAGAHPKKSAVVLPKTVEKKGKKNPAPKAKPVTHAQLAKVAKIFRDVRNAAAKVDPKAVTTTLVLDAKVHDSPRHFAMTGKKADGTVTIHVAPELANEPTPVIVGVIRHEFGHVLDFLGHGLKLGGKLKSRSYDAKERRADKIAEKAFKTKIYYDKRGVEVSGPGAKGKRPRPKGLK